MAARETTWSSLATESLASPHARSSKTFTYPCHSSTHRPSSRCPKLSPVPAAAKRIWIIFPSHPCTYKTSSAGSYPPGHRTLTGRCGKIHLAFVASLLNRCAPPAPPQLNSASCDCILKAALPRIGPPRSPGQGHSAPDLVSGTAENAMRTTGLRNGKSCEYPGRMWKKNPLSRIKRVIARDTTYGVYLLTGTISGSNFAFPRT